MDISKKFDITTYVFSYVLDTMRVGWIIMYYKVSLCDFCSFSWTDAHKTIVWNISGHPKRPRDLIKIERPEMFLHQLKLHKLPEHGKNAK